MRVERISAEEALRRGRKLPYALIRTVSSVTLGENPEQIETEELLEARFFSDTEEIRLFRQDRELKGAAFIQEMGDCYLEKAYQIENPRLGRQITVRYELDADEDGQTYISSTRISGWKGN